MSPKELNKKYFAGKTRGYKILNRYYYKYSDLFRSTIYPDFNDFLNQIFLNVSGIDYSKDIQNLEAYIISSIKIQCRVQLDKALRSKKIIAENHLKKISSDEYEPSITEFIVSTNNNPHEILEGEEILNKINLFKLSLKKDDIDIINFLIDDKSRSEMVEMLNINLNTLDTKIRRIRMKFLAFLKKEGYKFKVFSKYEKN